MNSQVDKSVITTTVALISALVLLAAVLFMGASLIGVIGNVPADDGSRKQAAILERIQPVTQVSFEVPKPAIAVQLSGQQVYDKVCAACHVAGTLGAPKTGAKEAWEPRFAQGMDTLVNHAVNGIRAMPAKGGDPSLTEANIHDSIVYMLGESGIKVEAAPSAEAAAPAPTEAAAPTPNPAETVAPASASSETETAAPAPAEATPTPAEPK